MSSGNRTISSHIDLKDTLLIINEEVTLFEYDPLKFLQIREIDGIDRDTI